MSLPDPNDVVDIEGAVSAYRVVYDALAGVDDRMERIEQMVQGLAAEVRQALVALQKDRLERAATVVTLANLKATLDRMVVP